MWGLVKNKQDSSICLSKPWEKLWKPNGKGTQKQPTSGLRDFAAGCHRSVFTMRGCDSASITSTERNYLGLHHDSVNPINQLTGAQAVKVVLFCLILIAQSLRLASKTAHWPLYTAKPTVLTFSSSSLHLVAQELLRHFSACQKTALRNTVSSLQWKQKHN